MNKNPMNRSEKKRNKKAIQNESETENIDPEYVCIRINLMDAFELVLGPSDDRMQQTLRDDVKNMVAEWLHYFEMPPMSPEEWQRVRIELVAFATVVREEKLKETLKWVFRHPKVNSEIRERVREVLLECFESV